MNTSAPTRMTLKDVYYYKDNRMCLSLGLSGVSPDELYESRRVEYQHNSDSIVMTIKYPSDSIAGEWTVYEQTIYHVKNNNISDNYSIRPANPFSHYHIQKYSYEDDRLTVFENNNLTYYFSYENGILIKVSLYANDEAKTVPAEVRTYQYENGKLQTILKYINQNGKLMDIPLLRRNFWYSNDKLTSTTSSSYDTQSNKWYDGNESVYYTYDKTGLLTTVKIPSKNMEISYTYEKGKCEDIHYPQLEQLTLEDIQ